MVRVPLVAVALVVIPWLLAGCLDDDGAQEAVNHREEPRMGEPRVAGDAGGALAAPRLAVGSSWTYRTDGYWDNVPEVKIVVAEADTDGSLFAAGAAEMLEDEIAWDQPYLGRFDAGMRPIAAGGGPHGARLLDFPLEPGKTWDYWNLQLTAQPANITVLGSTVPGYRITGENDAHTVTVEYAPEIGFVTRFIDTSKSLGEALWSLELTAHGTSEAWTWFERGEEVVASALYDPFAEPAPFAPPTTLTVGPDDTHVFAWGLATQGSTGIVTPPAGAEEPWTFEGAAVPNVRSQWFDAAEGDWTLTGTPGDAEGWVYIQGHALRLIASGD